MVVRGRLGGDAPILALRLSLFVKASSDSDSVLSSSRHNGDSFDFPGATTDTRVKVWFFARVVGGRRLEGNGVPVIAVGLDLFMKGLSDSDSMLSPFMSKGESFDFPVAAAEGWFWFMHSLSMPEASVLFFCDPVS